jgi:hypothetical protein
MGVVPEHNHGISPLSTTLPLLNLRLIAMLLVVAGAASQVEAGQPVARQTFSIRVPGRVQLTVEGQHAGGSLDAVRVNATERVEVIVERRAVESDPIVPVLRSSLTNPKTSFALNPRLIPNDGIEGVRQSVLITVVPH